MPLLSLADFDHSLKLNQLLQLNPLLNTTSNLLNAQINLITAESILNGTGKQTSYSRYKTELCRQFSENGQCKYGDKCQFAHGFDELKDVRRHPKYKTDFCKTFHSKGFCPYGPRCHFIHDLNEKFELIPGMESCSSTSPTSSSSSSSVTMSKSTSKLSESQLDKHLEAIQSQITSSLLLNIKHEIEAEKEKKIDCQDELYNQMKKDEKANMIISQRLINMEKLNSSLFSISSENGNYYKSSNQSLTGSQVSSKSNSVSLNASPSSTTSSSSSSSMSMGLEAALKNSALLSNNEHNELFTALHRATNALSPELTLSPMHNNETPIRTRSSVSSTSSSFSTVSTNSNVSSSSSASFDFYNMNQQTKSNLLNFVGFNNNEESLNRPNKYMGNNFTHQIIW